MLFERQSRIGVIGNALALGSIVNPQQLVMHWIDVPVASQMPLSSGPLRDGTSGNYPQQRQYLKTVCIAALQNSTRGRSRDARGLACSPLWGSGRVSFCCRFAFALSRRCCRVHFAVSAFPLKSVSTARVRDGACRERIRIALLPLNPPAHRSRKRRARASRLPTIHPESSRRTAIRCACTRSSPQFLDAI